MSETPSIEKAVNAEEALFPKSWPKKANLVNAASQTDPAKYGTIQLDKITDQFQTKEVENLK